MRIKRKTKTIKSHAQQPTLEQTVDIICKAAEDKKANEITALDISKTSTIADYYIIICGESFPQLRAIAESIIDKLAENNVKHIRLQGTIDSGWLIMDLSDIVVHIMGMEERKFYELDKIWGDHVITYHL